ncbi:MAG: tRNA (guanine(46)-N(7))-methyltransferase TrmB [Phycisphaerales bacterium JB060]
MPSDLGRGKTLDDAPGVVAITKDELGSLPDDLLDHPDMARRDPSRWFEHPERPLEIEVGPGKGGYLIEAAQARPNSNFLAIEQDPDVYYYTADRVRRHREAGAILNARVLRGDAVAFLKWRVADQCVRTIHLYYSDPWPKRKHHKNRVLQDGFLADCWRVLRPGGELRLATDHDELWAFYETQFATWCQGVPAGFRSTPFECRDLPKLPSAPEGGLIGSNFERKFKDLGATPRGAILTRREGAR